MKKIKKVRAVAIENNDEEQGLNIPFIKLARR